MILCFGRRLKDVSILSCTSAVAGNLPQADVQSGNTICTAGSDSWSASELPSELAASQLEQRSLV